MIRFIPFALIVLGFLLAPVFGSTLFAILLLPFVLLGTWDLAQTGSSLFRIYPVIGHIRVLAEQIRPRIQQYFVESDTEGKPFDPGAFAEKASLP